MSKYEFVWPNKRHLSSSICKDKNIHVTLKMMVMNTNHGLSDFNAV